MTPADNNNRTEDEFDDQLDDFSEELPEDEPAYSDDADYVEDDWDDTDDDTLAADPASAPLAQQKNSKSSNKLIIAIAVIVGFCVLLFQVVTSAPDAVQKFQTALGMTGSTEGPIFGDKPQDPSAQVPVSSEPGFLATPDTLPGGASPATQASDVPPQPSPIMAGEDTTTLTPMPADMPPAETTPDVSGQVIADVGAQPDSRVPRAPEDEIPPTEETTMVSDISPMPATPEVTAQETQPKAEDILKNAIQNRSDKSPDAQAVEPNAENMASLNMPAPVPAPVPSQMAMDGLSDPVPVTQETPSSPPVEKQPDQPVQETSDISAPAVPVTPAPSPTPDPQLAGLTQRLDEMEKKLFEKDQMIAQANTSVEDMKKQLEQARQSQTDAVATASPSTLSPEDQKKMEMMNTRLAELEKQLSEKSATLENTTAELERIKSAASAKDVDTASAKVSVTPEASNPVPQVQNVPPAKKQAVPKAVKKKLANPSPRWILRAAQPGRAWVSKPGDREMKALQVGDNLPGIGRIRDITFDGRQWTVVGTNGRINQ
jgi:intracellular multiplication protein IcmG